MHSPNTNAITAFTSKTSTLCQCIRSKTTASASAGTPPNGTKITAILANATDLSTHAIAGIYEDARRRSTAGIAYDTSHRLFITPPCLCAPSQVGTTKGTGGDILILEEAAYVEQGFFYETVAPLMIVGNTTLIGISTLTSEINFYTRLMRMRDPATGLCMFTCLSIQLACEKCKDEGKATECVHLLHLVPRWQSSERHRRLKTVMQDRPDLIQSELSGLAFESLQTVFRPSDIEIMLTQPCPDPELNDVVYIFIDPAAGGPQSDYAILSFQRSKGIITVSNHLPHMQLVEPIPNG